MRIFVSLVLVLGLVGVCFGGQGVDGGKRVKRIMLVPIDDRPAVTQFAEMIGAMADVEIVTPPQNLLGEFLQPGRPSMIVDWIDQQDLSEFDAVILSADMVAYGGLIASRVTRSSEELALKRLQELWKVRKKSHDTPFYVYSALMRIAPTATVENRAWRTQLYYLAIAKEKYRQEGRPETKRAIDRYLKEIPAEVVKDYELARERNVAVQKYLVKMTYHGAFQHLVLGQDDTAAVGPQIPEIKSIESEIGRLGVGSRVRVCSGIDQISNNLVSKVISDLTGYSPTIRVVYSDEKGKARIGAYESIPVEKSLRDQIETSGGRLERAGETFDYALYVNTPERDPREFEQFLLNLKLEAGQGFPVAVADTNLGWTGTADQDLFESLLSTKMAPQLLSYAGWNTAGNSMGTTVPAANVYLTARHIGVDGLKREVALRKFLLHRLVNDYYYHKYVRPEAYKMMEQLQNGGREELMEMNVPKVEGFVRENMMKYLVQTFEDQMKGRPFYVGDEIYRPVALKNVSIGLPWRRAFEVEIDFDLDVRKANDAHAPKTLEEAIGG